MLRSLLLALALLWSAAFLAADQVPGAAASGAAGPDLPSLQAILDAAEEGTIVKLQPGRYRGPAVISRPLTLDGGGKAIIDGGGKGTVLTIDTDGATVTGLTLTGSGESYNDIDSGIRVLESRYNTVRDNVIEDSLFGIDLQQSSNNIVKRNSITSKDHSLGLRGDAIRLWYSFDNRITDNTVRNSRDLVVWYSGNNILARNSVENGRYGIHFMYAKYNLIEDNSFRNNSVGIFLMYSDDVVIRNNFIFHAHGPAGMGVGMKESSNTEISGNQILYCGTGLYLDVSPFQPDTTNRVWDNTIAYSRIGVLFLNDWHGNVFKENRFRDNIRQVSVAEYAGAADNVWQGNYWDDYAGFDRDRDGRGDTAYEPKVYADRLWMDVPPAAFFLGTPLMSLVDFLERLAPFSQPLLMLRDESPQMHADFTPTAAPREEGPSEGEAGTTTIDPFGLNDPGIGRSTQ
ncbi:nitrous oxide reductase family maturation protein NosD [Afifella sp. IM 167]|uniref:nitrous oxide reductase family maturation protein NosD n=1 Tax=Afifella sp. IM 167 TaxID=2033586 RepID=UPI001CCAEDC8|nr:nitrous oxide reductase family maturation protein NosD [Afifella sp. IM 167]MBZ8134325.1 copper ABC transporter substrate-binding protein [Afifella sp. IM 167]